MSAPKWTTGITVLEAAELIRLSLQLAFILSITLHHNFLRPKSLHPNFLCCQQSNCSDYGDSAQNLRLLFLWHSHRTLAPSKLGPGFRRSDGRWGGDFGAKAHRCARLRCGSKRNARSDGGSGKCTALGECGLASRWAGRSGIFERTSIVDASQIYTLQIHAERRVKDGLFTAVSCRMTRSGT